MVERRLSHRLDDAGAGCRRGVVRQLVEREEAVRDDLMVGDRRRDLAEIAHHKERDVVAPGIAVVEKYAVQRGRTDELDIAFLAQFPRQRLRDRLAGLDPAARQMPAADIAVLDQKDAPLGIDHQRPHAKRHGARETPIEV